MNRIVCLGYHALALQETASALAHFSIVRRRTGEGGLKTMRKPERRHRDSNPEPSDHMPSTLTTALSRHDRFGRLASAPKYSVTLARMQHYNQSTFLPTPARTLGS